MRRFLLLLLCVGHATCANIALAAPPDDADREANAAGWFHVETRGGRDVLVDPHGAAIFAFGVNHLGDLRSTTYFKSLPGDNASRWSRIIDDYRSSGFNVAGYGCPAEFTQAMPYFLNCTAARTSKYFTLPPPDDASRDQRAAETWNFPDVWSDAWKEEAKAAIERMCAGRANDRLLIGYFWTDTPTWDISKTRGLRGTDWVSTIRNLSNDAPGKQQYMAFLRERYANRLDEFCEYYNAQATSLDDLSQIDFRRTPVGRHAVLADDRMFLGRIAQQYYRTIASIQRECDPNHLVFGDRYLLGDAPDEVLAAARDNVDVIAVQPGDGYTELYPPSHPFPHEELDRVRRLTGKPILICDHQISFPTSEYSRTTWTQLASEADAARATREFIRVAASRSDTIGYLRCQYIDRPAPLGRGVKQGLLNDAGRPHALLLRAHQEAIAHIQRERNDNSGR